MKVVDVTLVCALDVCRAASRIQPTGGDNELPLQVMASEVAHEVKVSARVTQAALWLVTHDPMLTLVGR